MTSDGSEEVLGTCCIRSGGSEAALSSASSDVSDYVASGSDGRYCGELTSSECVVLFLCDAT